MTELIPLAGTLGLELLSAVPERVEGHLAYSPYRCTADGVLYGGALMALADSFGGVCAYLNLLPGAAMSTIESKTNFFRAVREGRVDSVSHPLHAGRSTIAVQTDLFRRGRWARSPDGPDPGDGRRYEGMRSQRQRRTGVGNQFPDNYVGEVGGSAPGHHCSRCGIMQ